MKAYKMSEQTSIPHSEGTICLLLDESEAGTLMDLCAYVETRGVGVTKDMFELCGELGPDIEIALGYNKGNGD